MTVSGINVEVQDKVLTISFDKPEKLNSIDRKGYRALGLVLRHAAKDDSVTIVVITGKGNFFTSGNDLSQVMDDSSDIEAQIKESNVIFKEMVSALIECPKLTLALVNGPCIGIGATLAGLCDIVWCSSKAYFLTPFTKLGIVPECCSSYLFPLILGSSKAKEMLLLSQKLSAQEAYNFNFVSRVFEDDTLDSHIWPAIREFSELPPESMQISKSLIRMHEKDALYRALNAESEELYKRFTTEEFVNALVAFRSRKNKSKL
ncbi:PREDICTED: enoyl-CoA delta isomerase 2, mitochondrial [Bactrocera latifrons]|uniref:Enoyl-CoA delta isomerase 2, mitochondrial n=1 Tax=Bactrocera latifrons TaxID=174628 RepID=A0A0K8V3V3_BACLA|nr:PREDICTED: enoyl-CoA delta isomerase 2, mitochondrial [Bactrocera latifrons]